MPKPLTLQAVHTFWKVFEYGKTIPFQDFWEMTRLIDHHWLKQVTVDEERRRAAAPKPPKPGRKR